MTSILIDRRQLIWCTCSFTSYTILFIVSNKHIMNDVSLSLFVWCLFVMYLVLRSYCCAVLQSKVCHIAFVVTPPSASSSVLYIVLRMYYWWSVLVCRNWFYGSIPIPSAHKLWWAKMWHVEISIIYDISINNDIAWWRKCCTSSKLEICVGGEAEEIMKTIKVKDG